MANPNAPFGLVAVRGMGQINVATVQCAHQSSDGTALYIGDPVTNATLGSTSAVAGIPDGTPIVTASGTTTTTAIYGVVASVQPTLSNLTLQYCPASVNLAVNVYGDPAQTFWVQSNGTVQVDDIGDTMGLTSGSGSTTTGLSAYVATESTGHADNAYVIRVLRLAPIQGNLLGANSIVECKINLHENVVTTTG